MKVNHIAAGILTVCFMLSAVASAQVDAQSGSTVTVPRLIRITGSARDEAGKPLSGNQGITFTLYQDEGGQLPVWQETQNLQLDSSGRFSALLGATSEAGLPLEIFSAGEARWLGVRPEGQEEQPRILFVSVAYALKAVDTDMLGGRPASAYLLAGGQNLAAPSANSAAGNSGGAVSATLPLLVSPQTACSAVTSDGNATPNQIAMFTTACNIENSVIFESGGNIGIGNTAPAGTLDVSGTEFVRGALSLTPSGAATATQGYDSNPLDLQASAYSSTSSSAVTEEFQLQAEPSGNDTSSPSGTLNLLFGANGSTPTETGLSIASSGVISFAKGQTFPGTGSGTVTSVATGSGLTGGPITSSGTISIPSAGVTNAMLANNSVTVTAGSGLSGGGSVALGGSTTLSIPSAGVTNAMLANNSVTVTAGSGLSGGGTVPLGGTITLTNSAPSLGGTVTSVGSGTGLTGGPITTSGTLSLDTTYTNGLYLQLAGGTLTGGLSGTTGTFSGALAAGAGTFSGAVTEAGAVLPPTGTATTSQGYISNPLQFESSVYNSGLSKPITYVFQWQAEPLGNDSEATSSSLNLLWGTSGIYQETGLSIAKSGIINFASGQTFPGGGGGTVTQVSTGAGLTGGPITTSGTISIPSAGVTNAMLANDSITITAGSGLAGGGTVALGGNVTLSATGGGGGSPTLPYFVTGSGHTGSSQAATENVTKLWGFLLPYNVTTTHITYDVYTVDKTANDYDIGIYNTAGALVVDLGATAGTTFAPSAGFKTLPWSQGSTSLPAGEYYLAFTTNCSSSCGKIAAGATVISFATALSGGASSGGALPASVTPPANTWSTGTQPSVVIQ